MHIDLSEKERDFTAYCIIMAGKEGFYMISEDFDMPFLIRLIEKLRPSKLGEIKEELKYL